MKHFGNKAARTAPYPSFKPKGMVYFVGAGPGNPELLTLKAKRLLADCDLVAYDDLVHPEVLNYACSKAELLPVGYRARGEKRPLPTMRPELLEAVKRGKKVVRLKTGDPLVLARGAEEAQVLRELGIPFEFVPGITAALGAASYSGIPLTARDLSSGFRLTTGHTVSSKKQETMVFYMVRHRLEPTLEDLFCHGFGKDTKVAFIASATTSNQRVIHSDLGHIREDIAMLPMNVPGLLIVGEVVDFAHELSWFNESRPLGGHRLLIARSRPGVSKIAEELKGLGADVINIPHVKASMLEGSEQERFRSQLCCLETFDALLFTSPSAVEALIQGTIESDSDLRYLPRLPILAVGKGVEAKLRSAGLGCVAAVEGSCLKELSSLSSWLSGKKVAVFQSDRGRPNLIRDLKSLGACVDEVSCYRYESRYPRVVAPEPSIIIAPSSSSLKEITKRDLGFPLENLDLCVMGKDTLEVAEKLGFKKVYMAPTDSVNGMVGLVFSRIMGGS